MSFDWAWFSNLFPSHLLCASFSRGRRKEKHFDLRKKGSGCFVWRERYEREHECHCHDLDLCFIIYLRVSLMAINEETFSHCPRPAAASASHPHNYYSLSELKSHWSCTFVVGEEGLDGPGLGSRMTRVWTAPMWAFWVSAHLFSSFSTVRLSGLRRPSGPICFWYSSFIYLFC